MECRWSGVDRDNSNRWAYKDRKDGVREGRRVGVLEGKQQGGRHRAAFFPKLDCPFPSPAVLKECTWLRFSLAFPVVSPSVGILKTSQVTVGQVSLMWSLEWILRVWRTRADQFGENGGPIPGAAAHGQAQTSQMTRNTGLIWRWVGGHSFFF